MRRVIPGTRTDRVGANETVGSASDTEQQHGWTDFYFIFYTAPQDTRNQKAPSAHTEQTTATNVNECMHISTHLFWLAKQAFELCHSKDTTMRDAMHIATTIEMAAFAPPERWAGSSAAHLQFMQFQRKQHRETGDGGGGGGVGANNQKETGGRRRECRLPV